jgi:6-pyruvoyltetrahydropterin/6-carboxytetrahydropterin synthase
MRIELARDYRFDAAHRLPRLPDGHKCKRLHGHTYMIEVRLEGEVDEHTGFLLDFADVDKVVEPVIAKLDHYYLNEIEGLDNPTSEILARWMWQRIIGGLPQLHAITVAETCDSRCTYKGK